MKDAYRHERATAYLVCEDEGIPLWIITDIRNAGETGKGHASAVLLQVCADADAEGAVLSLVPSSSDPNGMQNEELEAWYSRYGFVEISNPQMPQLDGVMVRGPRTVSKEIDSGG